MSIANEQARLIPIILGLVKVPFHEVAPTGAKVFRAIDKHGLGAVDLHVFRRELMKLDVSLVVVKMALVSLVI